MTSTNPPLSLITWRFLSTSHLGRNRETPPEPDEWGGVELVPECGHILAVGSSTVLVPDCILRALQKQVDVEFCNQIQTRCRYASAVIEEPLIEKDLKVESILLQVGLRPTPADVTLLTTRPVGLRPVIQQRALLPRRKRPACRVVAGAVAESQNTGHPARPLLQATHLRRARLRGDAD